MRRYDWVAVNRDGSTLTRWNADGSENRPDRHQVREFHLIPTAQARARGLRTFSLFLKPEQSLIYAKRRHLDAQGGALTEDRASVIYLVGYEEDHHFVHFASYAMLLPDGRVEWSSDYNHITRYERNLDVHPLRFYER